MLIKCHFWNYILFILPWLTCLDENITNIKYPTCIANNKYMDCIFKKKRRAIAVKWKSNIYLYCAIKYVNPKKREEINELIGLFCCLFAIFCLLWYWVMWWHTLQKCMLIVGARSMGLTYFLWFSSWTATAAHVKQPNVFHSFWLGEKKQNKKKTFWCVFSLTAFPGSVLRYNFFTKQKNIYILYNTGIHRIHAYNGLSVVLQNSRRPLWIRHTHILLPFQTRPFFVCSLCFSSALCFCWISF